MRMFISLMQFILLFSRLSLFKLGLLWELFEHTKKKMDQLNIMLKYVLSLDFDEIGKKRYVFWMRLYPNLRPWLIATSAQYITLYRTVEWYLNYKKGDE